MFRNRMEDVVDPIFPSWVLGIEFSPIPHFIPSLVYLR